MTELEKIKRAKMYMDKLANGINPIDDTTAPEEDIINNVRLSRCFFFVSDVLRQIIEHGGVISSQKVKSPKKLPFSSLMKSGISFLFPRLLSQRVKLQGV